MESFTIFLKGGSTMDKGFFGGLFDLNNDGKLNSFERAMDLYVFNEMANHTNPGSGIISSYYG